MTEYEGQPLYVTAGFLVEAFESWLKLVPNDEWGELMQGYHYVARKCLGIDDERAQLVMGWFITEYERFVEEDWYGDFESDDKFRERVAEARQSTVKAIEHWRERAKAFKGSEALEDEITTLPEWATPTDQNELLESTVAVREEQLRDAEYKLKVAQAQLADARGELEKAQERGSTG